MFYVRLFLFVSCFALICVFVRSDFFVKKKKKYRLEIFLIASINYATETSQLENLPALFVILGQSKTPFKESSWLTGRHTQHWWFRFLVSPRYRTPCHSSGHLAIYASDKDLRERFLLSGVFYLTLLPSGFKANLGSRQFILRCSCWSSNIAPARLFVLITTIHKIVKLVGSISGLWLVR